MKGGIKSKRAQSKEYIEAKERSEISRKSNIAKCIIRASKTHDKIRDRIIIRMVQNEQTR